MKPIATPVWVLALLVIAVIALVILLWSSKRRRRPKLKLEPTGLENLTPSIAGLTSATIVQGNRIELVQNGAMWDRLFADFESARETINYETFLAKEGELTRRLTEVLCRKAKEGVQVRVLLDGSGGKKFGKDSLSKFADACVNVGHYHPTRISNLGRLNNRDHRKIAIIDGRIGYVGGHCLTDEWLGEAQDKKHFRDISEFVDELKQIAERKD